MAVQPEIIPILRSAFPSRLQSEVDAVLAVMPAGPGYERDNDDSVSIQGEKVKLLGRIYSPEPSPDAMGSLSQGRRLILSCLYTRHHDGHVRERQVPNLMVDEPWVAHFVLQLISEYVIEIYRAVEDHAEHIHRETYQAFAAENPKFMSLVRSRIVSYWKEYYGSSVDFVDYPGYRFLSSLGLWIGPEARRWIRKFAA
jgi:hypothetical protein